MPAVTVHFAKEGIEEIPIEVLVTDTDSEEFIKAKARLHLSIQGKCSKIELLGNFKIINK